MKYVVILGDGMADFPMEELNNKTPLMVANTPTFDLISKRSFVGVLKTVPDGMSAGSDVANLSVLGYDPLKSYSGRSPLEAVNIGVNLTDTDVTYRANLVTLDGEGEYENLTLKDYSGGEISTADAKILIDYLKNYIDNERFTLYSGVSYRHCLVKNSGGVCGGLTPPHDISGKVVSKYLPSDDTLLEIMKKSHELLSSHPLNKKRISEGKNPANSLWLWGEGTKPSLENYQQKYGVKGGMISAVDLLKGIAKLSGMQIIEVSGATGNYKTDFMAKARACVDALNGGLDFVYVHIEAADECGHQGDVKNKIYSIEQIDKVSGYVIEELKKSGEDFKVLICPDHPTPISIKTHSKEPVPFMIYSSKEEFLGTLSFDENTAKDAQNFIESGEKLMKIFFN